MGKFSPPTGFEPRNAYFVASAILTELSSSTIITIAHYSEINVYCWCLTPILDKLLEYKSNWIQHVNRMPRNNDTLLPDWQKESWQTFEEASGHV
jgi:hypothetical protein